MRLQSYHLYPHCFVLSSKGGPEAMIKSATSYAGVTYLIDVLFAGSADKTSQFEFADHEVIEDTE